MTSNRLTIAAAVGVSAVALTLGGLGVANASGSAPASVPAAASTASGAAETDTWPGRSDEQPLTGTVADKVRAAALAKVPGATVIRLETDSDGVYEAHLRKADGTTVVVAVDKNFTVTSVQEHPGPGGPMGRGLGAELTGATLEKVTAAVTAKLPGSTVMRTGTDPDGGYLAVARESDGTMVLVHVSTAFAVTSVEDLPAGGRHGRGGHGGWGSGCMDDGDDDASSGSTDDSAQSGSTGSATTAVLTAA